MTDPQLYKQMVNEFDSKFASQTLSLQQEVRRILVEHTAALQQSLEVMQAEQVVQESERDPLLRTRVEHALAEAMEKLSEVRAGARHAHDKP